MKRVKVKIFTVKGHRFYNIKRGKVFCTRQGTFIRRNGSYGGPLEDGTSIVYLSELGYDDCDEIR